MYVCMYVCMYECSKITLESIIGILFEGEMIIRTLPTTLLQMYCKMMLNSQVIVKFERYHIYRRLYFKMFFSTYGSMAADMLRGWWTLCSRQYARRAFVAQNNYIFLNIFFLNNISWGTIWISFKCFVKKWIALFLNCFCMCWFYHF